MPTALKIDFMKDCKKVELGEICEMFSGGTPDSENKDYYNGDIPFIRSAEISGNKTLLYLSESGYNNSSAKMVDYGDLLYALYGANSGECAISKQCGAINQAILCIRSKNESISYIYYILLNKKKRIISKYLQGGQGNLSAAIIKKIKINLPPIEEQEKIAEILSTQDKFIELKQKLVDRKKQQKKWLMQNLLTGKIRLKDFEGEWKKVKLGNIADVKGGKRIPKGYQLQNENNGFPYITVSDMENGTVNKSTIKYVPIDIIDNIKRYKIYSDDIYISVAGTLGLIGTIPKELNGANLTENADKICDYHCNKQYLISMLSSEIIQNQIKTSQTNNAQPKLAIEQIKNFVFNLPQLEEQTAIAEILSAQDKEIELLEKQLEQEKLKKKALIQFLLKEE